MATRTKKAAASTGKRDGTATVLDADGRVVATIPPGTGLVFLEEGWHLEGDEPAPAPTVQEAEPTGEADGEGEAEAEEATEEGEGDAADAE